ncbi:MAG: hypothetical protein A3C84_02090 [Candidatus Ryanbacteria bacterium RIFCSPHIGHO2_02_FULL_48_12]|uniref:SET domain-containing protein n=1 Tax=Candidatus Ryanbacteria bacterium RIFCSPHIGHO2_01_FULL_48_27 TaxID=1802115 RepID=A0A1G2G425_9BACT|nr:MAG: hypothetical protein A2756_04520 [Candidatus Ryanbacteria bacterium RIFCSPHIGHO2_01_FULL_48_27]OGZ49243.1 MAG: hypothetical protein A3C84_02090 [Candidatus Ryanbacteria bacterium RIFCSPHIGHO2_02_FULL_48_12]
MDSKKAQVRDTKKYGAGVFAGMPIKKGEVIAEIDGRIYTLEEDFDDYAYNHAIQFAPEKWRASDGIADQLNHSCEPNCGIKARFKIVAMRDVAVGEELTWDYGMTEDFQWRMRCRCGTPSCRRIIGDFKTIPKDTRIRYKGYISAWLVNKYKLNRT